MDGMNTPCYGFYVLDGLKPVPYNLATLEPESTYILLGMIL